MLKPRPFLVVFVLAICFFLGSACAPPTDTPGGAPDVDGAESPATSVPPAAWALAIHGGAGVINRDLPEAEKQAYYDALRDALAKGRDALERGESSLDVVEMVVRTLENAPQFNAGKGAVFTHEGGHELDAAIMDGSTLAVGAVTGVRTVKNPVVLARLVMTETPHVLLAGAGAEAFADTVDVERVAPEYFDVPRRYDAWQRALAREAEQGLQDLELDKDEKRGTVGAVALDRDGHLAAATSTGGLTNKRWGRVGDVPIIGAGTYANDRTCAVSGTGIGEKFIRNTVASDISSLVGYSGKSVEDAARTVIHETLDPGDGGVIVVGRDGSIALVFNTSGMFRGAADANGRFDVAIWEDE